MDFLDNNPFMNGYLVPSLNKYLFCANLSYLFAIFEINKPF